MRKESGKIIYSPSDLVRYLASPYASWMDRYFLENPGAIKPDEDSEERKLIARTGDEHEQAVLAEMKAATEGFVTIDRDDLPAAKEKTNAAIKAKAPIIYQAALESDRFVGFADFIIHDGEKYQIWDTKLARSPKPYYAIQLCCYSEMFANSNEGEMPQKFGIILGSKDRVEFRVEDYIHYYQRIRDGFLAMQDGFTGNLKDCPEPLPAADHGRWASHADTFFDDTDHLVRVAGITVGQIKKLKNAGIATATELADAKGKTVPKLANDTFKKLVAQARLQVDTRSDRTKNPEAPARFEVLSGGGIYTQLGLGSLPPEHIADVFFDMEGYPLLSGGLEYLFGVHAKNLETDKYEFYDWWAHNRDEEKAAFEAFVDWVFKRWRENPGMHIYHYAAYEVNAVRRLSTRHDTLQDEVDELLRHEVFVDLYSVVRHGLRIGEDSYSIKKVEHLYRPKRSTEVATAVESIVQYAQWIESKQAKDWQSSSILKGIRDYNEDDCKSTLELLQWMRKVAAENGIPSSNSSRATALAKAYEPKELTPEVIARLQVIENLRAKGDSIANTLADLTDFHRREEKPVWWRMFDRAQATSEELRDDTGCIEGVVATGTPWTEKRSLVQSYTFDPQQECKLTAGERKYVKFSHELEGQFNLTELDLAAGTLQLKISTASLNEKFGGSFPQTGSLIPIEVVDASAIKVALTEIGQKYLSGNLPSPAKALIEREAPALVLQNEDEKTSDAAVRVASSMNGGCLVIQGPPGTGKTYTAAHVINALVDAGKRVGVASNGHKAIINLLIACGEAERKAGGTLRGIKVGGEKEDGEALYSENSSFGFVKNAGDAQGQYSGGIIGGTAWLFVRPEWEDQLDYLFIDEAGQVSLANTIAMSRSAKNLILLGDQMQLEQPVEGTHPGDSGLSGLQYALKDLATSKPDDPTFHAVVPSDYGLFLGESRRMHPSVCTFISESIYEGRLTSYGDCAQQRIALPAGGGKLIDQEHGIVFSSVEHDGNIQQSDEEVERVVAIYSELLGRPYTSSNGTTKDLELEDFLFIAPYNAQVRALQSALPQGARVGSVDKFQGQQAPVCILSLCSSYGEYGGRGLAFILDRNRINVAVSRAQCLAVVVADPRIATTPANSLSDMKLINLLCKLAKY